jgi:hypothetical protein
MSHFLFPEIAEYRSGAQTLFGVPQQSIDPNDDFSSIRQNVSIRTPVSLRCVVDAFPYSSTSIGSKTVIQSDLHEGGWPSRGQDARVASAHLPATRAQNH